jgi:metal-responsive CopG/Arc/MetJ family transcriptional regulator
MMEGAQGVSMPLTNDKLFQMRTTADFLRRVDDWRRKQPALPSRSEAIRYLVDAALAHADKQKPPAVKRRGD